MTPDKIIVLGGGGHARVLIDIIRATKRYIIAGILDPHLETDILVSGISVLGSDDLLFNLYSKGIKNVCIAVGGIKDNIKRRMLYEKVKQINLYVPPLIHPQHIISESVKISDGVQIMAGAIVQTESLIGENTIINTGSIIEHDCRIGKHVHICPGTVISGGCTIREGAFIGAGATVIQGVKIGKDTTVAAGSVVVNDLSDGIRVKGVPAK